MIQAKIEFDISPIAACDNIAKGIRRKFIRVAMNAGASRVKEAMISYAPKLSGALQESIKIKIVNFQMGAIWTVVIGPKSKWAKKIGRGKNQSKFYPGRYFRQVEFGNRYFHANPFMLKAAQAKQNEFVETVETKIGSQIDEMLKTKAHHTK